MDISLSSIIALLVVLTIHECSHALVAYKLGDPTAKLEGRISLNPLVHLDLVGTFMILFFGFGWAKPTPVNPRNFTHPLRDNLLTSLAGPFSNLLLALVLAIPLKYLDVSMPPVINDLLWHILNLSLWLFAFNILPIPPLDGASILEILIPKKYQQVYGAYIQNAMAYFIIFVAFDAFILTRFFDRSIVDYFIGHVFVLMKSLLFLGT